MSLPSRVLIPHDQNRINCDAADSTSFTPRAGSACVKEASVRVESKMLKRDVASFLHEAFKIVSAFA